MTGLVRVVIVDDQAVIRGGLRLIVDNEPDLTVVGEAGDGDEAVRVVAAASPHVVLMDIRMPGTDGGRRFRPFGRTPPEATKNP